MLICDGVATSWHLTYMLLLAGLRPMREKRKLSLSMLPTGRMMVTSVFGVLRGAPVLCPELARSLAGRDGRRHPATAGGPRRWP
jgi:hypothetical protein